MLSGLSFRLVLTHRPCSPSALLPLSLDVSLTPSFCYAFSLSHTHMFLSHSLSRCFYCRTLLFSITHTRVLSASHALPSLLSRYLFPHNHPPSLSDSFSLTFALSLTRSLSDSFSHSYVLSRTRSLTRAFSLSHLPVPFPTRALPPPSHSSVSHTLVLLPHAHSPTHPPSQSSFSHT